MNMNENNNINQNVTPDASQTVAPVDATPAAPVEVPVQPVPEAPAQPVEVPVQPVAEVPVQPAPVADPNVQFSTQPTEQPAVQPAVQPGVPPVAQPTVQQPVAQPVVAGAGMQPQKKNNLPFILIVVLLLAIIGCLAGFLIFKNVKSDSSSSSNKTKTEEKEKKKENDDKPTEVANTEKINVGEYSLNLPKGYTLYSYESGAAILVDTVNKVQLTLAEVQNVNVSALEQNAEKLKESVQAEGAEVGDYQSGNVGTVKWFCMPYKVDGLSYLYLATDLNLDLLEVYVYNAGTKDYKDIVLGINEVLSSATKNGSSFSGKKEAYDSSKLKLFYPGLFE